MADPITGAAVSGLVKLLFDKLGSPLFKEIERSFGVKSELKRIRRTLSAIDAVLVDAEEQQTTQRSVRDWLLNLKDVAYDIEDVLDLISTQALEDKVHQRTLVPKVRKLFPQFGLAKKLKAICGRLEEISANRRDFHFQERQMSIVAPPAHTNGVRDQSPFIQESSAFGRKEDQDWIVSRLVSSSSSHEISEIPVLPIVGMGGMGKTTLAKLVFNDPRVKHNFSLKLWASLPKEFSMKTVIQKIFECVTEGKASDSNMQAIEKTVHAKLAGKTFLLVLDNVWASTPSILSKQIFLKEWADLKDFLEVGSMSSRIIVTTREDMVVFTVRTMEAYKLKPLPDDACWSIFAKYAFRDGKEKEWPSLVEIGKEIVRKCCGVPLAARTLGSQLWNVRDELQWKRIEESKLWNIEQAPDDILPALKLSFDQLPFYLKACFSFCSTMSKTHFESVEMEYCWMALGLMESRDMNGIIEESGTTYFNQLLSRSFFEVVHAAQYYQVELKNATYPAITLQITDVIDSSKVFEIVGLFQMHDLVHDLGRYVGGEETAFVSFDTNPVSARVRHLVWTERNCLEREFPSQLLSAKKARSFQFDLDSKESDIPVGFLSTSFLRTVAANALPVRVRHLVWTEKNRFEREFPSQLLTTNNARSTSFLGTSFLDSLISNFRCLRILSLSSFEFEELPNSIGDSKHLRYLDLGKNCKLKKLPDSISKLVNLQTLIVSGCTQLEIFPKKLHKLISLRHLYFTSKLDSCLETCYHGWTSIQKLSIIDCAYLIALSEKIGTLTTLRFLDIYSCPNLASLPNTMQLLISLEQLRIVGCKKLKLSGWKGLNGLINLQVLIIDRLPLLEHFPDGLQYCTSLLKLLVLSCKNFSTLPRGIESHKRLQYLWMIDISPVLRVRCERGKGEDWKLISHIPSITVR